MARKYEERTEAVTKEVLVSLTCDLCGAKSPSLTDWSSGCYDVAETELSLKVGKNYPDGGGGNEIHVDICPKCFRERLLPWLESQGVKVVETEWDW